MTAAMWLFTWYYQQQSVLSLALSPFVTKVLLNHTRVADLPGVLWDCQGATCRLSVVLHSLRGKGNRVHSSPPAASLTAFEHCTERQEPRAPQV